MSIISIYDSNAIGINLISEIAYIATVSVYFVCDDHTLHVNQIEKKEKIVRNAINEFF